MATQTCLHRLRKELKNIQKEPPPHITARPYPSDILKWYFVIQGPQDSSYKNGRYLGKLVFSQDYPYKPPAVYMITPSGRFKTNTKLCLSMSDFHPETWNPLWSVSAVLTGLLSFMLSEEETVGSLKTSDFERSQLAIKSHDFNRNDKVFKELFGDLILSPEDVKLITARTRKRKTARDSNPTKTRGGQSDITVSSSSTGNKDSNSNDGIFSLFFWLFFLALILYGGYRFILHIGESR